MKIFTESEWSSAESLDNHIVAIVGDHGQGEDLVVAEKSSKEGMDLATHVSKAPWSAQEEVVDAFGEKCQHQQEIGDGQVHHQQVSRSTEGRESAEDLQDDGVAGD